MSHDTRSVNGIRRRWFSIVVEGILLIALKYESSILFWYGMKKFLTALSFSHYTFGCVAPPPHEVTEYLIAA